MEWQSYYVFLLAPDGREFHFENETIAIADGKDHNHRLRVPVGCRWLSLRRWNPRFWRRPAIPQCVFPPANHPILSAPRAAPHDF